MSTAYDFAEIESRIQRQWESTDAFSVTEDPHREKFYCLAMFPYPSGRLHIGHVRNYTIADAIARYQRQLGKNVLNPIGWDAFGLPAENAANQNRVDPHEWTGRNIEFMRQQLKRLGMSYDWKRELATCEPDYYRWEQWFFQRLYEKKLIYRKRAEVNWDPVDKTVLANEQVIDGCGWRSGAPIERRTIEQWFIRITDYAEELLSGLERLEHWPSQVVQMQKNWLGRSEGAEISFPLIDDEGSLTVFTTRPDTLFGVVALVVSPMHRLVDQAMKLDAELRAAVEKMRAGARDEASLATAPKLGYRLPQFVKHPLSGETAPVFVGNYVLESYGSGVVMSVPAHDQRDFEFAKKYHLPIPAVVMPLDNSLGEDANQWDKAYTDEGVLRNSGDFNGMKSAPAKRAIVAALVKNNRGAAKVSWRLRDWGISRQRYWGCPIPAQYDEKGAVSMTPKLPVTLPPMKPTRQNDFIRLSDHPDFSAKKNPRRETDTLDTFFESSWYYARFCCYDCDHAMVDERARYWLPVDQYVGGIEHAVLHLLYFRFFHKLMRDLNLVEGDEPATKLLTQGMVVAQTWSMRDENDRKVWVKPEEVVVERENKAKSISARHKITARPVRDEGMHKMSKSKNNGVDPDDMLNVYGADATRMYVLFAAPPEQDLEWSSSSISGCTRFLRRLYGYVVDNLDRLRMDSNATPEKEAARIARGDERLAEFRNQLHRILKKALYDYRRNQFNTVTAAAMELMNLLRKYESQEGADISFSRELIRVVLRLLAPITPHIVEELWRMSHQGQSVIEASWPSVDNSALAVDKVKMLVQINSRNRGFISVPVDVDDQHCENAAVELSRVEEWIDGSESVVRVIVVKNKLVNIVIAR